MLSNDAAILKYQDLLLNSSKSVCRFQAAPKFSLAALGNWPARMCINLIQFLMYCWRDFHLCGFISFHESHLYHLWSDLSGRQKQWCNVLTVPNYTSRWSLYKEHFFQSPLHLQPFSLSDKHWFHSSFSIIQI